MVATAVAWRGVGGGVNRTGSTVGALVGKVWPDPQATAASTTRVKINVR
jgi:hypothetical protein